MENTAITAASPAPPPMAATSLYEKNKLRIAGFLNGIGDVGLLVDGFNSKSLPFKLAGWLYTTGALVATLFGSPNKEQQVKDLTERAAEFVQTQNSENIANLESAKVMQNKDTGIIATMGRTLRRYSGQIMLVLYTLGAGAMLTHGIKGYQADKAAGKDLTEAKGTIGYGIASLSIKGLSLLVKEDAAPDKKPATGVIGWFKEKPMRIFGYGSLITETMMGWRTYGKYKKSLNQQAGEKESYGWAALTTGSYIVSDLVIAGTNKDAANAVGKMTEAEQDKLENMMAETIAVQPEAQREKLSSKASEFLKKESIVNGSAESLRESILKRANQMWADRNQSELALAEAQRG